jgi:hypothetical protein
MPLFFFTGTKSTANIERCDTTSGLRIDQQVALQIYWGSLVSVREMATREVLISSADSCNLCDTQVRTAITECSGNFKVRWMKETITDNEQCFKCSVICAIMIKDHVVLLMDISQIKVKLKSGEYTSTEKDKVKLSIEIMVLFSA